MYSQRVGPSDMCYIQRRNAELQVPRVFCSGSLNDMIANR